MSKCTPQYHQWGYYRDSTHTHDIVYRSLLVTDQTLTIIKGPDSLINYHMQTLLMAVNKHTMSCIQNK